MERISQKDHMKQLDVTFEKIHQEIEDLDKSNSNSKSFESFKNDL